MTKKKAEPKTQLRELSREEKDQVILSAALSLESLAESMQTIAKANEQCMAVVSACLNSPIAYSAVEATGEQAEHLQTLRKTIVSILNS